MDRSGELNVSVVVSIPGRSFLFPMSFATRYVFRSVPALSKTTANDMVIPGDKLYVLF
jgi:hypothetical protein